jgi:ParB family chromosome partitioning protein
MDKKKPQKKSSHLQDLEQTFERQTRRFSPFAVLGIEQESVDGQEATAVADPTPGASAAPLELQPHEPEAPPIKPSSAPSMAAIREQAKPAAPVKSGTAPEMAEGVYNLPLSCLEPSPDQPRVTEDHDADQELVESIRRQGVMTPIHVRPIGPDRYEVIAGERRWRACKLLGKEMIPALIRTSTNDEAAAQALIDNLVRKDLSALEEAKAFKSLIERHGYQQGQLADRVGCHKSRISLWLNILKLPAQVLDLLFAPGSGMTAAHAEALLPLLDQPARLERLAQQAVKEGWTRQQIREEVNRKPRTNAGAQSVRFQLRGQNGQQGFVLTVRFHRNRPHDIPMIEEALAKAASFIKEKAGL